jgi:hypothetical protein
MCMPSTKRLRSVVHSIAHHAMSGLCCVHPYLGQARKALGVERISVDLLRSTIEPALNPLPSKIEVSTDALRERFVALLSSESLDAGDLASAVATFVYKGDRTWPDACLVQVQTTAGIKVEDAVADNGRRCRIRNDG